MGTLEKTMSMKKIQVSTATNNQLDWLVAKCEGHDVVVLTVAEQRDRWLQDAETPEEREKLAAEYDQHFAPHATPQIRILAEDGYKRQPYLSEAAGRIGGAEFQYTTNPAQMWPIIDREGINISVDYQDDALSDAMVQIGWKGNLWNNSVPGTAGFLQWSYGPTSLIAAARCYVASKLGEVVEIPEELT